MTAFLIVACVVVLIGLILLSSVHPLASDISAFELKRRKAAGDKKAAHILRREALLPSVRAMQQVVSALLLVGLGYLFIVTFGWLLGSLAMLLVIFGYGSIARLGPIHRISNRLYNAYEPLVLRAAYSYKNGVFRLVQNAESPVPIVNKVDSREELEHILASTNVLSPHDKTLITHALQFDTRQVHEIMTPKSDIKSVPKKELLGPLVLDDLHQTGHEAFPVVDGSLNTVVGILSIEQLLIADSGKTSTTAEKAMDQRVPKIVSTQPLNHLLDMFIKSHARMVIVEQENETVGIVTLSDVIKALIGHSIEPR